MAETTIYVEAITDDGHAAPVPLPGLLLSLGDGRAVEMTPRQLALVLRTISFPPGMRTVDNLAQGLAPRVIAALIQQAQEADRGR